MTCLAASGYSYRPCVSPRGQPPSSGMTRPVATRFRAYGYGFPM
jgi:hypothetical protein